MWLQQHMSVVQLWTVLTALRQAAVNSCDSLSRATGYSRRCRLCVAVAAAVYGCDYFVHGLQTAL